MVTMNTTTTRGFLTLELLIATMVFSLVMTGAFLVASEGQTMGLDIGMSTSGIGQVLSSIQSETQNASALAGFSALANDTTTQGPYTTTQIVRTISPCLKALSHDTGWTSEQDRNLYAQLETYISSIEIAETFDGGCDPIPPSTWDNPSSYGSIDVGGSDGTGVAVRSVSGTRYAFLSSSPSALGQEDFYVFDVEDPENPTEEAKINTGAGLNGVAAGGAHVYTLQNQNTAQLQSIDVGNPSAPVVVASVTLPNMVYTCSPASAPCLSGRSIAYHDGYVYIGTQYLAFGTPPLENNEFHIFDVSTPSAPVWKGSVNVDNNVNDIEVRGTHAYLATSGDARELVIVDIEDPTDPEIVGTYDAPWSTKDAWSVALLDSVVYLGRARAAAGDYDFLAIDVAVPSAPTLLGKLRLGMNGASAVVTGLVVQGTLAFVGTSDTNDEFRVIDVSNPAVPVSYGCPPYNYSARVHELVYADNYIFAANESNDSLRIIYDDPSPTCH